MDERQGTQARASERVLDAEIVGKLVICPRVLQPLAGGQQQMVVVVEIVDRADIEARAVPPGLGGRGLVKHFGADCQLLGNLPLQQPAHEKIIAVAGARIDPVAAAAIEQPGAAGFL